MNQPNGYEENQQAEAVSDLPLTTKHAEQTKAGSGFQGGVRVGLGDIEAMK